jgi:FkbM family methyltransferase
MNLIQRIGQIVKGEELFTLEDCIRKIFGQTSFHERWRIYDAIQASGAKVLLHATASHEAFLVDTADNNMARSVFVTGDYQYATVTDALARLLEVRPGLQPDTLIDIGANIGVICIPAVARGHFSRAIAIEPTPSVCRVLRANIALNGMEKDIEVYETALSNIEGEVEFELSDDNSGDNRISVASERNAYGEASRRKITTPVRPFDALALEIDLTRSLAWIDVQGFEGFVLAGAEKIVRSRTPLVLEFWPYGLLRANCYELLRKALSHYEQFCVLGGKNPWRAISQIDVVFDQHKDATTHEDILVI